MTKEEKRAIRLQEQKAVRKKNVGDYFVNFSRHLRPWLHELAQKYKERGEFPLMPMVLLPSYYKIQEDKEIAVFAALLMNDGDRTLERVKAFRKLLGDSPWEWFAERKFVALSIGRNQNKRTGGVENWKIARLFDLLWQEHFDKTTKPAANIGQTIKLIADIQQCSYFEVLTYLLEICSVGDYFYKLRLLLMVCGTSDGVGIGLWSVNPSDLRCPLTHDLRTFLSTWFPDYRRYGSVDDAVRLFGFDREIGFNGDCDFFYCCLVYKELQKKKPKECGKFATTYRRWYEAGAVKMPYEFRAVLPEI